MESSDIVYKYRNWQNQFHKKTLYKNEIYLSKPSEFNDPFDCRIPTNYFLISDENLENFIGLILNSTQPYLTDLDTINSEKQMLRDRFADRSNFQLKSENIEFDLLNNHSGVFCVSYKWNSLLMWSHYANCHKGFCIGYYEEDLRNSRLFGRGGPVNYDKVYPAIKPNPAPTKNDIMLDYFTKTHTKSIEWEYEMEYRFLTTSFPEELNRLVKLPEFCIAEIILGVSISDQDKKEILIETERRKIKTFQALKVPFKFELDRVKIN